MIIDEIIAYAMHTSYNINPAVLSGMLETLKKEGGGGDTVADSIVDRTITSFSSDTITSIGDYAFYKCGALATADFPVATSIGSRAFDKCGALATVDFPLVTSIGSNAFQSCSALTTADFPAVTSIGNSAFQGCSSLATADFPAVTSIGSYAFSTCSKLTTVNFPVVTSIGGNAFQSCSALTTVNMPRVTSIGSNAFQDCSKLTTADFTVAMSIGSRAFYNCAALTAVILRKNQVVTLDDANAFGGTNSAIIYVPDDLVDSYKADANWSSLASRIKGISEQPIYQLSSPTAFDGTSTFIDTGLQLMGENKESITIAFDCLDKSNNTQEAILHCMHEEDPWPGIAIQTNYGYYSVDVNSTSTGCNSSIPGSYSAKEMQLKVVVRIDFSSQSMNVMYKVNDGIMQGDEKQLPADINETVITETALIGCYQNTAGTKDRYWKGTMYDFRICDYYWSQEETREYLQ